jgi:transcriptional regulator
MYVSQQFAVTEEAEIADMLRSAPLGSLVTHGGRGLFASHLPFIHDASSGVLAGHLARANPHRGEVGDDEALVIFQGANAYVSPSWYPSKAAHGRVVPTWNYETVHVYGRLIWREEPDWLLANVVALTERFEAVQSRPWAVTDAPPDHVERLIAGIIGVELRIGRIEAKRKLSQNRSEADRQGVIAGLAASGSAQDEVVATLMRSQRS